MQTTRLGQLKLQSRIMNAAGPWAATKQQLKRIYHSKSGAVVTKSFTLKPTIGNPEPNKYFEADFSINSVGLTNKGADYFIKARESLGSDKPIMASVAEKDLNKLLQLVKKVEESQFDAIELNLSCPNVRTKEPVAYDSVQLDEYLKAIFKSVKTPIGIKLPPFTTNSHIEQTINIISKYPVNHLVAINTYPFASAFNNGRIALSRHEGIGGLGGKCIKPIALAHVLMFKKLAPQIPIVAVGGVSSSSDVHEFISAGATAVQIGTAMENEGYEILNRLAV